MRCGLPDITVGPRAVIATFGFQDNGGVHRGLILFGLQGAGKDGTMGGCTTKADGITNHRERGDNAFLPPPTPLLTEEGETRSVGGGA